MSREIAKGYEPQLIEPRWAEYWVKEELFRADPSADTGGKVFSIVIPPPNVTGSLHIGHMLDHTEIDILTRWHRMRGYNTLYLPGTDHASISTQRVVVRQLQEQGIDYRELGREEFLRRAWKWKEESGGTITGQMKQIGESCDWSREKFTFSPEYSEVVYRVFVQLYEEGFIYRGHYLINWCPECLTVLSDLEVVHEERLGHLWHIKYPVPGTGEFLVVATTRPETMLGDTAVAVHPEDERFKHLVGKKVLLPLMNREIPIIADEMVDREFGTGAVKITPAHDLNDFEVGRRHSLPEIDVMTDDGHMNANAGAYGGLDRFAARKTIVEDLKGLGLLEKVVEHMHAVGLCERSKTIVEPRASTQWFCKMKPLAEPAIAAVERGEIRIVPENRREEYFNWMRNIRDWTLSRQLWWGHQIPAWYCKENKHVTVAREAPAKCATCGSGNLEQDPDVLDTWFSSALWPFVTLGWPEKTADFKTYYPTTLLITGYDILFFWVARMIMLGIHFTGEVPFRAVYLHSLVRTASGEKMSKSKGTGLDPVALNQQYGTDAMRFCLASMAAPGTDIALSEDRLLGARAFANKIWNAARFLFMNLEKFEQGGATLEELAAPDVRENAPYSFEGSVPRTDGWLFSRLARTADLVNDALKDYRFHEAAQGVYQFFWGDFCDWYIESVKLELQSPNRERATVAWKNLFAAFDGALRLLHPFMPFLTEELWHKLPQNPGAKSIALMAFPVSSAKWKNEESAQDETDFGLVQEIIEGLFRARVEAKLDPKKKMAAAMWIPEVRRQDAARKSQELIKLRAGLSELEFADNRLPPGGGLLVPTLHFEVSFKMDGAADKAAMLLRVEKEISQREQAIVAKNKLLAGEKFLTSAPPEVVKREQDRLMELHAELARLLTQLHGLRSTE